MYMFPKLLATRPFKSPSSINTGIEEYKSLFQEALTSIKDEENPIIKAAYLGELKTKLYLTHILFPQDAHSQFHDISLETNNLLLKAESQSSEKLSNTLKETEENLNKDLNNSLNKRLEAYVDYSYNLALLRSVSTDSFSVDFQAKLSYFEHQLEEVFKKKELELNKEEKQDNDAEKEEFIKSYKSELKDIVEQNHTEAYDKLFQLIFHSKKLDYVLDKTSLLDKDEFTNLKNELSAATKCLEGKFFQECKTELEDTLKKDKIDLTDMSNIIYPLTILFNIPTNMYSKDFMPKLSDFFNDSMTKFAEKLSREHARENNKKHVELEEECREILQASVQIPMLKFDVSNQPSSVNIPLHTPDSTFKNGDIILKGRAGRLFAERIQRGESQKSILQDLQKDYPTDCFQVKDPSSNSVQDFISSIERDKLSQLSAEKYQKEQEKLKFFSQDESPANKELIDYKNQKLSYLGKITNKLTEVSTYQELLEVSFEYQNIRRQLRNMKFNEWNQKKIVEEPQIKQRIENWKNKNKADLTLTT